MELDVGSTVFAVLCQQTRVVSTLHEITGNRSTVCPSTRGVNVRTNHRITLSDAQIFTDKIFSFTFVCLEDNASYLPQAKYFIWSVAYSKEVNTGVKLFLCFIHLFRFMSMFGGGIAG